MPDHWFWCVKGLQGLTGMLRVLNESEIRVSKEALALLEKYHAEIGAIIETQKHADRS